MCNKPGEILDLNEEKLVSTIALNLTSAGSLQFTIGQTSCIADEQDTASHIRFNANITIFFGQLASPYDTECSNWNSLQTIARYLSQQHF